MGKPAERIDLLFDARHIDQSGIGTYIDAQLPALEKILGRHGRTLAVLADRDNTPSVCSATSVVYSAPPTAPMYSLHEQQAWDRALTELRPRAFWTPHYPFPFTLARPRHRDVLSFVTVHDDNHLLPADISGQSAPRRAYARAMLAIDARRARIIFTPSRAAADALADYIPSARFVVTPIPVGQQWFATPDLDRSPVRGRFLLYFGNVKRHKNLPAFLEAYAAVQHEIPHRLVIAGSGASVTMLDERVHKLATTLGERVQMLGRLEFDALHALVAAAELLVMPSLNEGAGLPPLEAMASGTAVLSSRIPSLSETCGSGADYFDPHDPRDLAHLLRHHCLDDRARTKLQSRGQAHVRDRQARIPTHAAAEAICAELKSR